MLALFLSLFRVNTELRGGFMKNICFSVLFLFAFPHFIVAQYLTMTATPYTSDVQTFMLSDFNFSGRGTSSAELFLLTIANHTAAPQQCELHIEVFSEKQGLLSDGQTKPFTLQGNEQLTITNQNLFTKAQQFSLQNYQIKNIGNELKSIILATGRLPADTYIFHFRLYSPGANQLLADTEIRFVLTNPSNLDLISPGIVAGSDDEGLIYTPFPLFRWESDISTFQLTIAEQLPDAKDELSPEEVMQQRIIFQETFTVRTNQSAASASVGQVIPSTLFQYPISGARPLDEGVTYYWQITGLVTSSGDPLEIPSEIWKFKIVGTGAAGVLTPLQQQILHLVRELDGSLLKPGGELAGFIPTENATNNGIELHDEAIIDVLTKLVDGEFELLDMLVE